MTPAYVRYSVGTGLALIVGGAIYLMVVRGPVMLIDLANSAASLLCL